MPFLHVLEYSGLSDIGQVRTHNEDAIEICPESGFVVLADGMGGYNAGEVASTMTTDVIAKALKSKLRSHWAQVFPGSTATVKRWIRDAVQAANDSVIEAAQLNSEYAGMGTTVVVAHFHQNVLLVAHVGDSRAYRYRADYLTQITHDHSVLQAQIDAGLISAEFAQFSPIKNLITRAVGVQHEIDTEITEHALAEGDIYLLCSDGLTDMLNHDEIHAIMAQHASDLGQCCQALVGSANANGGRDNISVVLCRVKELRQRSFIDHIFAA
ncbi:Stp1/IreP family PP2C-type Ser/Thr phosphatase [Undibacterium sp.]|jgi:serine/threonine protein phosphatase PrpC|uniref:Stp1/IreP family PP2C-type Ser/Thr phosphatase n=1 Tax=Undibacterium sp. TaxID=1914977 RepID=UPI002B855E7D|nr:Stp1/IreP family PP2C-type Ser/Thr phosphatase [Undibacterium sp.]HTD02300.1 Stp1/IreP family PP2C-type Ser/Thr phosphatase [Undibacterium sp.]